MCQELRSARSAKPVNRSTVLSRRSSGNTLSSTDFTRPRRPDDGRRTRRHRPRQAGCMAKTEKRRTPSARLPSQVDRAAKAADGKKAVDLVVLDLRKAAGFTDFFVIASGTS